MSTTDVIGYGDRAALRHPCMCRLRPYCREPAHMRSAVQEVAIVVVKRTALCSEAERPIRYYA
jgi:hypothetical protein